MIKTAQNNSYSRKCEIIKYKMCNKCRLRQFLSKYEFKINENVVIDKSFFNVVNRMTWVYS